MRIPLRRPEGTVQVREEGLQAVISARAADDGGGLYKLHLLGKEGNLLLGTMLPEWGVLRLRRTIPVDQLRRQVTIVLVTHSMQQAVRVSQRTAFFLAGELVECADTGRLFTMPRDPRTERYITGRF